MKKNIDYFRNEVESALRNCLALRQFRKSLRCKECVSKLNENVYFWIIFQDSVQTNLFIKLRRLFDQGADTFNFYKMMKECEENIQDFSKNSLRLRKVNSSDNAAEWIEQYMINVHEVTVEDFKNLRKIVKEPSKLIEELSREVANKVYAHAIILDKDAKNEKLKDLNLEKIETCLSALWHTYQQIWQMYENGRKPTVEILEYSHAMEVQDAISKQIGCMCEK